MESHRQYDVVRVVRLRSPDRHFTGTESVMRAPRIGDIGTICHDYCTGANGHVAVEMVREDGLTVWLADFHRDELEAVDGLGCRAL